jgi:hypothetical protein
MNSSRSQAGGDPPSSPGDNDAGDLKRRGWRQGSVLPPDLASQLIPTATRDDLVIVATHDCDLLNPRFDVEPEVELIHATPIPAGRKDGRLRNGRNPRRLHLSIRTQGGDHWFETAILSRKPFDRRALLNTGPDPDRQLGRDNVRTLRLWLGRRYYRVAFPDAFNERTRAANDRVRKQLEAAEDVIDAVYLFMEDDGELPPGEPYRIDLRASMLVQVHADPPSRLRAQKAVDAVAVALRGCPGIQVDDAGVFSEDEISLDDLRWLKRWDWDWISLEDPDSPLPPAE